MAMTKVVNGEVVKLTPEEEAAWLAEQATPEEQAAVDLADRIAAIKAEAGRRIDEFAPLWKQLNAERAGGADSAALFARIDAIRAASDALEVLTPIPDDYAGDKWWPNA